MSDLMGTTVSRISTMRTALPSLFYKPMRNRSASCAAAGAEAPAYRCAEDRRDEVTGLGNNFVAGHGVFGSATNVVNTLGEVRLVCQRNVDNGHAQWHEALQLRVRNELHFGAFAKRRGVFHVRSIMRRRKGDRFVEKHHGNYVLQANVRDL